MTGVFFAIRAIQAIGRSGAGFGRYLQLFSISRMAATRCLNGNSKPAPGKSVLRGKKEFGQFRPLGVVVRVLVVADGIKHPLQDFSIARMAKIEGGMFFAPRVPPCCDTKAGLDRGVLRTVRASVRAVYGEVAPC